MRSAPSRRTGSPLKTASLVLATMLIGGGATLGGLWAAGVDLPFLHREPDHRGLVAVPITTRAIPAFTSVTRDYLLIPEKRVPKYMYLPPEMVKHSGLITRFDEITGRVVDHPKAPGCPFTEKDFLPRGTRSGLVAGIPAGKRALTIDATKIQGIHSLRIGDRLDMLASQPIDMQKVLTATKGVGSPVGASALQVGLMSQQKQATVRVLVQNGAMVSPVTMRVVPISSNSLTQGAVTRTKPIQEVVIAIDPEEIAPLTEAIAVESNIMCVARSGLPDDPGPASVTPSGPNPADQVDAIERIVAGKREVTFVSRGLVGPADGRGALVAVPLCGRPIAAQARITADHLLDPATNRPHLVHIRPGDVRRLGLITDPAKIVGRILVHRKDPDTAFKDEDFLPQDDASSSPVAAAPAPVVVRQSLTPPGPPSMATEAIRRVPRIR